MHTHVARNAEASSLIFPPVWATSTASAAVIVAAVASAIIAASAAIAIVVISARIAATSASLSSPAAVSVTSTTAAAARDALIAALWLTVIARSEATASIATAASTRVVAATRSAVAIVGHLLEEAGNLLIRFDQQLHQIGANVAILVVEEARRDSQVTHAAGTTDSMHILLDIRRQIVIDDVLNVRNVQTASSDCKLKPN